MRNFLQTKRDCNYYDEDNNNNNTATAARQSLPSPSSLQLQSRSFPMQYLKKQTRSITDLLELMKLKKERKKKALT
jgi:hypothetical protein